MLTRRLTTALAALAFAGLSGACGNGDGSDDAGPASIDEDAAASNDDGDGGDDGGEPDEDAMDAPFEYAECMRENGIDMPDPEVNEDGGVQIGGPGMGEASPEEFEAAEAECGHILDDARADAPPIDPEELAERQDQAVALAECMRGRGHDFPDPVVDDNGGVRIETPAGGRPGDAGSEEFEADMEECHEEAGMPVPGEGDTEDGLDDEVEG